jgi:hypothetical protein
MGGACRSSGLGFNFSPVLNGVGVGSGSAWDGVCLSSVAMSLEPLVGALGRGWSTTRNT